MTDEANDLYEKAIELSKRFDERFLQLARTLRQLRVTDQQQFRLCVENSQISLRTAYYLLEVEETFSKLQVPEKRLRAIGWTKLQVIAKHVMKANINDALKLAEHARTRDLKVMVKGEWPEDRPHCVLMYMTTAQYKVFADMVVTFSAKRGLQGMADRERVLIEFIEFHNELVAFLYKELQADAL